MRTGGGERDGEGKLRRGSERGEEFVDEWGLKPSRIIVVAECKKEQVPATGDASGVAEVGAANRAAHGGALVRRCMFHHIGNRTRIGAAERQPLQDADNEKRNRCCDTNHFVSGQQADTTRGDRHQDH